MKKLCKKPVVSIVVVNHNGKGYLKDCFDSLLNLDYPKDKLELIMVDNCSQDGSVDFIKKYYPGTIVVENEVNNYCRANNLGIKQTKSDFVALLNNDTKVERSWLEELIKIIGQDEKIATVGSKVLFIDGKINSTGHVELPKYYWADRGFKELEIGQYNKVEEVDSVSGAACLFRRKYLETIGLFDEDFQMFLEDVDISIRLKNRGWKIIYCPDSIVYHVFHGTAGYDKVNFYTERNRLLLLAKHYPQKLADALFGNGYFTVLNNKTESIKILNDVFTKLVKHNNIETISPLFQSIFESLNKILNLEKHHLIKQKNSLEYLISQKDEEISQGKCLLKQKDTEIDNLKEKRDAKILDLRNKISQIYQPITKIN